MIEFGKTLRQAREAKGLTPEDIAEKTHMMIQQVVDLENDNFNRIAAPIYGRGFVRLYCEQVGLDPKPMIEEFMDIMNGNRQAVIRPRTPTAQTTPPPPPPPPPPDPEPAPEPVVTPTPVEPTVPVETPAPVETIEPEPLTEQVKLQVREPLPEEAPEPEPLPVTPEPPLPQQDDFRLESVLVPPQPETTIDDDAPEPLPEAQPSLEEVPLRSNVYVPPPHQRLSTPKPLGKKQIPNFKVPVSVWRIAALSVTALLVLWVLFASIRALYRLATTAPEPKDPSAQTQKTDYSDLPGAPGTEVKNEARKPLSIPALYID